MAAMPVVGTGNFFFKFLLFVSTINFCRWRVDDVMIHDDDENVTHPLTALKPYTQYAFYVKTYTIATERRGAQSKIDYFTTLPSSNIDELFC